MTQSNFFELVPLTPKFFEFVRDLRNNPEIKDNFITQDYITVDSHNNYMSENAKSYFLCLRNGEPVGFIGVVANDIRIAVLPTQTRNGAGTFMLEKISEIFPTATAKIKIENESSLKLFESVGYKKRFYLLEKGSK
jgi:hypothetical protein